MLLYNFSGRQGTVGTVKAILAARGPVGLYDGLSAAYLRQWTYGLVRMGLYSYLLQRQPQPVPFHRKLGLATFAGSIGAFVGTPSELGLVRMSADSQLPPAERRGDSSIFDVIRRVAREDGPAALWRGAATTVARAGVLSCFQMGVTSEVKQQLPERLPGVFGCGSTDAAAGLLVCGSVSGSVVAVAASNPIDVLKTRFQFAGKEATVGGLLSKLLREEGPLALWRGSGPAFVKLTPYMLISLSLLEWLTTVVTGHGAL